MKKLSSFFLNQVLYKKVYDECGDCIGKLWDVYVTTNDDLPRIIGYKIKKGGEILNYEFKSISFYQECDKMLIKVRSARGIIPRTYSYLLSKHLLNKKIVDVNGKKVVRVNDLRIGEIASELKVIAVDTGFLGFCRRFGMENIVKKIYKIFKKDILDTIVMWSNVESLQMVNNNLKLSVPYKKLMKLHPADLADILEEVDGEDRKKIFESFDEDLAADVLEEIKPDLKINILNNLTEDKRNEVLESMHSDEVADILDEVDDDIAEKILMNMEKENADEIRSLMKYEEKTVGSIMNTDFIAFNINISIKEVIEVLRELKPDDEVIQYIYILDKEEKLKGIVSLRDLIISLPQSKLMNIMKKDVIKIMDSENINKAIEIIIKYNLNSLPVVNEEDKLCGIVMINDLIENKFMSNWKNKLRKVG